MAELLQGATDLLQRLERLRSVGAPKVARAAVKAGLVPLKKQLRGQINAASVSPEMKRAIRSTLGSRVMADKADGGGQRIGGKVGFGVGKATKTKKEKAHARNMQGQGGGVTGRGVGISAADIHWAILGTQPRTLTKRVVVSLPDLKDLAARRAEAGFTALALTGKKSEAKKAEQAVTANTIYRYVDHTGKMQPMRGMPAAAAAAATSEVTSAMSAEAKKKLAEEAQKKG